MLTLLAALALAGAPLPIQETAENVEVAELNATDLELWKGRILELDLAIEVQLRRIDGDGHSGMISIPAQRARDLPLDVTVEDQAITLVIQGLPGEPTFSGEWIDESTITGTFTQSDVEFPFELRKATDVPAPDAGLDGLGPWMREAMQTWKVPGAAVAIVRGDAAVIAEGFGVRELGGEARVDADTLFGIGSASKAFTTLLLAMTIERGELSWQDKVEDLLPGFRLDDPRASAQLTVRDIVTHRLGLPRHDLMWYARPERTPAELVERMRYLPANAELRETYQYNNLGFVVAGEVLREVTGQPWSELVPERIFAPLGMQRSTVSGAAFLSDPNHATGHGDNEDTKEVEVLGFRTIDHVAPAGAIGSSANDIARWLRFHLRDGTFEGEALVLPSTLRELHTPQTAVRELPDDPMIGIASVAHGWFVDGYRGHLRMSHGGNIDGYSAVVAFFPNDDLGIACFTSKNGTPLANLAIRHAADLALGLPPRDWSGEAKAKLDAGEDAAAGDDEAPPPRVAGTSPSHPLAKYAGEYQHPGYGSLSIELEESSDSSRLRLRLGDATGGLEHWHFDTFRIGSQSEAMENPLQDVLVRFDTDDAGAVAALHLLLEPAVGATRFTAAADPRLADPEVLEAFVGTYVYRSMELTVSRRGDELVTEVPGQPTLTLAPRRDDTFRVVEAEGFSIRFRRDETGAVTAAELRQPNGTLLANRRK